MARCLTLYGAWLFLFSIKINRVLYRRHCMTSPVGQHYIFTTKGGVDRYFIGGKKGWVEIHGVPLELTQVEANGAMERM